MRPVFENGAPVPAFLNKLWKMVDDERTDNLIAWGPNGKSFIIKHQGEFCAQLLPQFYKHNNMASFVRQLNMYGFHKVSSVESGGLRGDKDEIEFIHPCFKRDEPKLVEHIKRKMSPRINAAAAAAAAQAASASDDPKTMEMMTRVLEDVAQMRGRQLSLDTQLATMKRHNVALWRELSILRRKHHKQQQIVNKLIQFLVSLVQPTRSNIGGLGVKRHYPLMINDVNSRPNKDDKESKSSSSGPIIHELDTTDSLMEEAELLEDYIEPLVEIYSPQSTASTTTKTILPPTENVAPDNREKQEFEQIIDVDNDLLNSDLFTTAPYLTSDMTGLNSECTSTSSKTVKKGVKRKRGVQQTVAPAKKIIGNLELPRETDSNDIPTIMISNVEADMLQAAANEMGFVNIIDETACNESSDDIVSVANPTLSSASDLNRLLQENISNETNAQDQMVNNLAMQTILGGSYGRNSRLDSLIMKNNYATNTNENTASTSKGDGDMTLATVNSDSNSTYPRVNNPNVCYSHELDTHLESMQSELDSLKDLLVSEGYSLDANTLLGLFGAEDPTNYILPIDENAASEKVTEATGDTDNLLGSEIMYIPPTFDILDMFSEPDVVTTSENSLDANDLEPLSTPFIEHSLLEPAFPTDNPNEF